MSCGERGLLVADILRDHVGRLHLDHERGKAVAFLGKHRRHALDALFVPLKALRRVFKGKLLSKLQALLREGHTSVAKDSAHERLRDASRRTWNIDIRRPFGGPEKVVRYFARYVRKIAISDHRLVGYDGQTVLFHYRDRRDDGRVKTAKLDAPTFCRSFLQHVLPAGFVRIRRYGLLSNRGRKPLLGRRRDLLGVDPPLLLAPPGESRALALRRIFAFEPELCPSCKLGRLTVRAEWRASRLPLDAILAALAPRAP